MKAKTKSADALAEQCAKTIKKAQDKLVVINRCEEMLTNRLLILDVKGIILRETKLRELCAVVEAARKLFQSGGNTISNHGQLLKALAALEK